MNLSNFSERLSELLFERQLNSTSFARIVGCDRNTIISYLNGTKKPSLLALLRMADFFEVTTDFLLGIESESYARTFLPCPPFSERLPYLCSYFGKSRYWLCKTTHLAESAVDYWIKGVTLPSVESLVRIAEAFGCSVEFVLGRSD